MLAIAFSGGLQSWNPSVDAPCRDLCRSGLQLELRGWATKNVSFSSAEFLPVQSPTAGHAAESSMRRNRIETRNKTCDEQFSLNFHPGDIAPSQGSHRRCSRQHATRWERSRAEELAELLSWAA
jgi:hypothetical protein